MSSFANVCMSRGNIKYIADEVMKRVQLTSNSRNRLEGMAAGTMEDFLKRLQRGPTTKNEAGALLRKLNDATIASVSRYIMEKYSSTKKQRRGTPQRRDNLSRDVQTYGNRSNGVSSRPAHEGQLRRETPNRQQGLANISGGGDCSFASAFGPCSFVEEQLSQALDSEQFKDDRNASDIEKRFQMMMASRKTGNAQPTPDYNVDLSLDGSGEAMRRKAASQNQDYGYGDQGVYQQQMPQMGRDHYGELFSGGGGDIPFGNFQGTPVQHGQQFQSIQGLGPMFQ